MTQQRLRLPVAPHWNYGMNIDTGDQVVVGSEHGESTGTRVGWRKSSDGWIIKIVPDSPKNVSGENRFSFDGYKYEIDITRVSLIVPVVAQEMIEKLQAELATVAEGERRAIEALRPLTPENLWDEWTTYNEYDSRVGDFNPVYHREVSDSITEEAVQHGRGVIAAYDERQQKSTGGGEVISC